MVKRKTGGFTLIEVMMSLILISVLLGVMVSIVQNAMTLNAKAKLRSEAGALAFQKIQDYINLGFDSVPIGDGASGYEVENFSVEAESFNLNNASATVYSEPASEIPDSSELVTTHSQSVSADTAYVSGSEINSVGHDDATNDWQFVHRIRDNVYSNYTYSRFAWSPDNLASPSIDLGSAVDVDTIRVNWFVCGYGANNFRIEAKNSSPWSNNGWTTIASGLSDDGISCFSTNNPQDIDVSSNTTPYRYWRLYFVEAEHPNFSVVSELEAFSEATPADLVEQHGADASNSPGALYFSSSDIELTEDGARGQQSIGMIFDDINATQGSTIDNAYIDFTADSSDASSVTLSLKAADVDDASPWTGAYAVDNAVDNDSSDGSIGTTATVTWMPPAWSSGDSGVNTQVEVTSIIQEIVDRLGWVDGNSIALAVQYISGSGKRVAERSPAPQLVLEWSETATSVPGNYVDNNGDGDVDNPTLLRLTSVIEYDAFQTRQRVEYSTFIRKFGVGD